MQRGGVLGGGEIAPRGGIFRRRFHGLFETRDRLHRLIDEHERDACGLLRIRRSIAIRAGDDVARGADEPHALRIGVRLVGAHRPAIRGPRKSAREPRFDAARGTRRELDQSIRRRRFAPRAKHGQREDGDHDRRRGGEPPRRPRFCASRRNGLVRNLQRRHAVLTSIDVRQQRRHFAALHPPFGECGNRLRIGAHHDSSMD